MSGAETAAEECGREHPDITIEIAFNLPGEKPKPDVRRNQDAAVDQEDQARRNEMEQNETVLQPKPVSESKSEMIELVLPNDANPLGALLGGRLMHWIDLAGALAAHRHSHSYVVTASMDHIDFLVPVHVGDMVVLQSSVNRVFKTSMEVGVKVSVENYISSSRQKVARAYLTFVAVDRHGRRLAVNPVIPETDDEKRRYEGALRRREATKAEREQRKTGKP
jgi:acyl-CoA hydrolase